MQAYGVILVFCLIGVPLNSEICAQPCPGPACPERSPGEEKSGTVTSYDKGSRMVTVKAKDWEQKAKVSSGDAKDKADLLKDGTKVKVTFEDRGGGDVRVKSLEGR